MQICPAPLQVHMGRSSTSSDRRSISKRHPSSLLISFKSSSTRTPTYQSVSCWCSCFHFAFDTVVTTVTSSYCEIPDSVLSLQCDPALLPEPNHVMLNHLYALSIKVHSLKNSFSVYIQKSTSNWKCILKRTHQVLLSWTHY